MEIFIFNPSIELIGVIDEFTSLIWSRRYYKSGEFELHLSPTEDNLNLLVKENIVYKKGDSEAGYIETKQIEVDNKGQEFLQIKGKFITNYIEKRINWGQLLFTGLSEALMRKLVDDNCVNPSDTSRKIPLLSLGALNNYSEAVSYQNSYGNVIEELENIGTTNGLGYKINFDYLNKSLKFDIYKGVNRSVNQSLISPCIFSRDFENILSQSYFESVGNLRDTALVAGEGEGTSRILASINNTNVGLNRHELFVDARDLQKVVDSIVLSDTEYYNVLIQRGNEKLAVYKEIKTFDSRVNTQGNNVYKTDYNLGDIVTVSDKKWGLRVDTRITEIEEVYEGGRVEINPTFGNNIPTPMDVFKRMVR